MAMSRGVVTRILLEEDPDLPEAPRLEIYKETFGGLENVTEEWYKNESK